jgi:hypothetical protein
VLILPSAFLAELLDRLWRVGQDQAEAAMENWLEEILLKHLPN